MRRTRRITHGSKGFKLCLLLASGHHPRLVLNPETRAERPRFTIRAIGVPGIAPPAPMPDQQVAEERPVRAGDQFHKLQLYLGRIRLPGQPEPLRKTGHMSVDDDAHIDVERIAETDVGGFPPHTSEFDKFLHGPGHLAAMPFHDRPAASLDAPGFVAKKAGAFYRLLQF